MNDLSQATSGLTQDIEEKILCAYQNSSMNWHIIKITNIPRYYYEKVILPGQRVIFQASVRAKLKVFSTENTTLMLMDTIACPKIRVNSAREVINSSLICY